MFFFRIFALTQTFCVICIVLVMKMLLKINYQLESMGVWFYSEILILLCAGFSFTTVLALLQVCSFSVFQLTLLFYYLNCWSAQIVSTKDRTEAATQRALEVWVQLSLQMRCFAGLKQTLLGTFRFPDYPCIFSLSACFSIFLMVDWTTFSYLQAYETSVSKT